MGNTRTHLNQNFDLVWPLTPISCPSGRQYHCNIRIGYARTAGHYEAAARSVCLTRRVSLKHDTWRHSGAETPLTQSSWAMLPTTLTHSATKPMTHPANRIKQNRDLTLVIGAGILLAPSRPIRKTTAPHALFVRQVSVMTGVGGQSDPIRVGNVRVLDAVCKLVLCNCKTLKKIH